MNSLPDMEGVRGKYLWERQVITFSDGTTTTHYYCALHDTSSFATTSQLSNYCTTVNANNTYAKKSDIPDVSNFVTEARVLSLRLGVRVCHRRQPCPIGELVPMRCPTSAGWWIGRLVG